MKRAKFQKSVVGPDDEVLIRKGIRWLCQECYGAGFESVKIYKNGLEARN